ncbi:MAG: alpha/beta fold hydrolase [Myxococcota bacterium]|nr:alpha/beta fold hydrolase [Myxococcota bacterium]
MHPALTRFEAIDVQANGLRFRVRTAGEGDRLALLLHGFPEMWFSWRDQMPLLAKLGYRVWAPDLRGYGESDKPRGVGAYSMDTLVEDVAALIDAAKAREVLLIAHDWGGAVAWEVVGRRVRKIDRFVAMNIPHPAIFAKHLLKPGPQLLRSWYMFAFQLPGIAEWYLRRDDYRAIKGAFLSMAVDRRRFPEDVLQVYRDAAAQPGALTAMLSWYRAAFRHPLAARRRPEHIDTPTLMIWGEEDKALGKELTFGTEDFVRDLTIRYVPDASHWIQQEAPETVNAMLEAWLTGERVPEAWEIEPERAKRDSSAEAR